MTFPLLLYTCSPKSTTTDYDIREKKLRYSSLSDPFILEQADYIHVVDSEPTEASTWVVHMGHMITTSFDMIADLTAVAGSFVRLIPSLLNSFVFVLLSLTASLHGLTSPSVHPP